MTQSTGELDPEGIRALVAEIRPLGQTERKRMLDSLQQANQISPAIRQALEGLCGGAPVERDLKVGATFGRFTLTDLIGEGGMGRVYEAWDPRMKRNVALKLIRSDLLGLTGLMDKEGVASPEERFESEAEVLGSLQHAGIVSVFDRGFAEGPSGDMIPFCAMELVEGEPLDRYSANRQLTIGERLRLATSLCEAVGFAHSRKVVHRDLKPPNILVDRQGQPRVLDFGLAVVMGRSDPMDLLSLGMGTPAWMAPEQVSHEFGKVSYPTDVYALGMIIFQLLANRPAYRISDRNFDVIRQTITETRPPMLGDIDPTFKGDTEQIVHRCLQKNSETRYAHAGVLADVLRSCLDKRRMKQLAREVAAQSRKPSEIAPDNSLDRTEPAIASPSEDENGSPVESDPFQEKTQPFAPKSANNGLGPPPLPVEPRPVKPTAQKTAASSETPVLAAESSNLEPASTLIPSDHLGGVTSSSGNSAGSPFLPGREPSIRGAGADPRLITYIVSGSIVLVGTILLIPAILDRAGSGHRGNESGAGAEVIGAGINPSPSTGGGPGSNPSSSPRENSPVSTIPTLPENSGSVPVPIPIPTEVPNPGPEESNNFAVEKPVRPGSANPVVPGETPNLPERPATPEENRLLSLAANLLNADRYDEAIEQFDRLLALNPSHVDGHLNKGVTYQWMNEPEKALAAFSEAIRIAPDSEKLYNVRGQYYWRLERYKEAVADMNEVIRLDPKSSLGYDFRGRSLLELNEPQKAVDDLTIGIQLNPADPELYFFRSKAYEALGMKAEAERDMKTATEGN